MTLLVAPKRWQKTKALATVAAAPELTADESTNVRTALRFLRTRMGTAAMMAAAMRVSVQMVQRAMNRKGKPGVLLALRAARLAGVSVEDVLGGAWPPAGACPHYGRNLA